MENDLLDAPVAGVEVRNVPKATDAERMKLIEYAVKLLTTGFAADQVHRRLVDRGCAHEDATEIISQAQLARTQVDQIQKSTKGNPVRDIIVGGLFLFGGLIGTFSNTGFIFYGAIIFGGVQFIKGLVNLGK